MDLTKDYKKMVILLKAFSFGMKNMRITQSYNGTVSHKPHWYQSKDYADYPIDIAGIDAPTSALR